MKLELKRDSWKNLFEVVRNSDIKSEGNFWAAIQSLETQFEEQTKDGNCPDCGVLCACDRCSKILSDIDIELDEGERKGVICFKCNGTYNHEMHTDEGYETISNCPHCGAKNSVRKY